MLLVYGPYCETQGPKLYVSLFLVWSVITDVINDHFGGLKNSSQQPAGNRTPSHHNKFMSVRAKISSKKELQEKLQDISSLIYNDDKWKL